ncbi:family 10 glycosylhydrolase, partial [bacterium]|nr:family 10 glycosylhydrolase [bacterium]
MKKILGIIFLIFIICAETYAKDNEINVELNPMLDGIKWTANRSIQPESIIYGESQKFINAIDPVRQGSTNSFYPGLRGPNQLIIYTPAYGERTGTNEFGTEAIVENNMVVRLNGADSVIPKNGFVISGHGNSKNWIMKNIQLGSKVYIDYYSNTLQVFLTPESLIYAAKEKIKEVNSLVDYYNKIDTLYNDKKANQYLEESKNLLRKAEKKPEKVQTLITEAMDSLNTAVENAIPYYKNELKGIWLRPVEDSPSEIEKTLDRIHSAGITDVFLETYFHGKTIYPSEYLKKCGVISQREEFTGFDPLEVWVKEAHKRGIKIHIWFESFYVGNDVPGKYPNHVLNVYPQWSNKRLSNYDSQEPVSSL